MTTTKTDLSTNFPSASGLISFQNGVGNTADADQVTANYNYLFGLLNVIFNYCIDQTPQTTIATTYTAQQSFSAGIKTDSIATYTSGGSLATTLTGSGTATITDGTYSAGRVLTTSNINALYGTGGAAVMTGATSGTNGVQGLAPQPSAGEQNEALFGDATYRPVVRNSNGDMLVTGTPSSGKTIVGTGANTGTWAVPVSGLVCQGRLTLASGTPVTTTDQTAKTLVYFTPYGYAGSVVWLYTSSTWTPYLLTEISVAPPATTVTPFDIFIYDNAGAATLEAVTWTNDTTRATALTTQDGVLVKTGSTNKRYLGTGRTTGVSGQIQTTSSSQMLWNYYNRRERYLYCIDPTNTWTYTTATYRAANGSNTVGVARIEYVIGVSEDYVKASNTCQVTTSAIIPKGIGIGLNSTSADSATSAIVQTSAAGVYSMAQAGYVAYPSVGYSYLSRLEISAASGTTTWTGTTVDTGNIKSSMEVLLLA